MPLAAALVVVVVVVGAIAWVVVTALLARREVEAVRAAVPVLRAELAGAQFAAARNTADELARHARRAHGLTSGPAWALAARIPVLGAPLRTARGIAQVGDELADGALRPLVEVGGRVGAGQLRQPDGRIDVSAITGIEPVVARATRIVRRSTTITAALPTHTWMASVDSARAALARDLGVLDSVGAQVSDAVRVLPALLGSQRPQTYFLAVQNNAEARGTGGLPGAFAIVSVADGRIRFDDFHSDEELNGTTAKVELGPDYDALWRGSGTESIYVNSNLSPHFPDAARIWTSMWEARTGRRVDGAVAVDPQVLSYLLSVTGPARLPDGSTVSADNIVGLTENSAYLRFGADTVGRKNFLIAVARAVTERMTSARGDSVGLLEALIRAARERRLLVWSADPEVQSRLEHLPVSGAVPRTPQPYAGLFVVNDGGNKLDYYLDRSLTWAGRSCGATRQVTVTIELRNSVPPEVQSPFLVGRSDQHANPIHAGDNRLLVYYLATQGALLTSATLDGRPEFVGSGVERGHPVFSFDVELPRMRQRELVLRLVEPAGRAAPRIPQQPLVRPMQVTSTDIPCG
jgi:hypothetical protein